MKTNLFDVDLNDLIDVENAKEGLNSSEIVSTAKEDVKDPLKTMWEKEIPEEDLIEVDEVDEDEPEDDVKKEEPKKEVKKEKDNTPSFSKNQSSLLAKTFATSLAKDGVIVELEEGELDRLIEEEGAAQTIYTLVQRTIDEVVTQYKDDAQDEFKRFISARDAGVDMNEYAKLTSNSVSKFSIRCFDKRILRTPVVSSFSKIFVLSNGMSSPFTLIDGYLPSAR